MPTPNPEPRLDEQRGPTCRRACTWCADTGQHTRCVDLDACLCVVAVGDLVRRLDLHWGTSTSIIADVVSERYGPTQVVSPRRRR